MGSLAMKEIRILVTERKVVCLILFFAAAAYALLIGNLYSGHTVQNIPVAVCDLDGSSESRALIQSIQDTDQYTLKAFVGDEMSAMKLLEDKEVAAVIVVPPDFSKNLSKGRETNVGFVSDGTNSLVQSYSLTPVQMAVGTFSAEQQVLSAMKAGMPELPPQPVGLSLRFYQNQTMSYAYFYLYGVMLTAAQLGVMLSFALSVKSGICRGTFRKDGVWKTLFVKEIVYILASTISVCIALFCLTSIFKMLFRGELSIFLPLYMVYAFAVANLAGLFALYFRTELAMVQGPVFYALPAFMLSGYIWPEMGMLPLWQWIMAIFPIHYISPHFRDLALAGQSAGMVEDACILLAFGVIGFVVNGKVLRKRGF